MTANEMFYRCVVLFLCCVQLGTVSCTFLNATNVTYGIDSITQLLTGILPVNSLCEVAGEKGVCENKVVCSLGFGYAMGTGNCAYERICCQYKHTCGGRLTALQGVFQNPSYPQTDFNKQMCTFKVEVATTTCAISINMREYSVGVIENGGCLKDAFTILNYPKAGMVNLCGNLNGHWEKFSFTRKMSETLEINQLLMSGNYKWFMEIVQYDKCQPIVTENVDCGVSELPAGGGDEKLPPWTAALQWAATNTLFCGATLITASYVITDAKCVYNVPIEMVLVYIEEIVSLNADPSPFNIMVSRIVTPWTYKETSGSLVDKLALVKMASPVKFSRYMRPICFPLSGGITEGTEVSYATRVYVPPLTPSTSAPRFLYKSNVVPFLTCQREWSGLGLSIDTTTFCSKFTTGPCANQLGHAATVSRSNLIKSEIAGIYAKSDCTSTSPVVYTNLYSYLPWLRISIV